MPSRQFHTTIRATGTMTRAAFAVIIALVCVAAARGVELRGGDDVGAKPAPVPLVMWHGMGDNCCDPGTMGRLKTYVESAVPGIYVHNVMVGGSPAADTMHGYFGNVNDQVAEACDRLAAIPELQNGFNAIGFSQGSLFIRAATQRCADRLKVKTLVTMGGPHQGVASLPGCDVFSPTTDAGAFCRAAEAAIEAAAYSPFTRSSVVQAQYFKDPRAQTRYLAHNPFLPDVNNEREVKNETYKRALSSLRRLVLVRFTEDTVVEPRDSAWFSTYEPGNPPGPLVPLRAQAMYREDWLGLRALDESGRLVLAECPGQHMWFTDAWLKENVLDKYMYGDESGDESSPDAVKISVSR